MLENLRKKLKKHGYRILFHSYHKNRDLKYYQHKKDAVSAKKFLTVLTPDRHVIGRIYTVTEKKKPISAKEIREIISFFNMFNLTHSRCIITDLESMLTS